MTDTLEKQITAIKGIFPSDISNVKVYENGMEFLVVEINHDWMFRFLRDEASQNALVVEREFLARFKSISPVPVPDHLYIGREFVGYRKIQGTPLHLELFKSLPKECLARIAQQLGEFLSAMHNFPVSKAKQIGLIEYRDDGYIRAFQEKLAPMLSPLVRKHCQAWLEQLVAEEFDAKVIHGDFALQEHVFFDETRQELSGVIDFGDVSLYDPAHDFQNIVEYGGDDFFEEVMRHYHARMDSTLLKRVKLRIQAHSLFEAFWLWSSGLEQEAKKQIEHLEAKYGRV